MRKRRAVLGSAVFFLAAPVVVAGVLPWWITGWSMQAPSSPTAWASVAVGCALVAAGLFVLVRAFVRFVDEGLGTPAPVAPTERLVVGGDYRYVRNPMYVAVVTTVLGQALVFRSVPLVLYAVVSWAVMAAFVRWHEEPVLHRRFGAQYESYRGSVRAWWPRQHRGTSRSRSPGPRCRRVQPEDRVVGCAATDLGVRSVARAGRGSRASWSGCPAAGTRAGSASTGLRRRQPLDDERVTEQHGLLAWLQPGKARPAASPPAQLVVEAPQHQR